MTIDAFIGGRRVGRDAVLKWEDGRARRVLKRLGLPFDPSREARRRALTAHKLALGHERLRALSCDCSLRCRATGVAPAFAS